MPADFAPYDESIHKRGLHHPLLQFCERHRFPLQPSLCKLYAALPQELRLVIGLHAFGDHAQLQALGHFNDVLDHMAGRRVGGDRVDEDLVNFQIVYLERLKG